MKLIREFGNDALAKVFVMATDSSCIECAESIQPPFSREEKWVLIISCLRGCPVKCLMCDASLQYTGRLSKNELFDQIDFLVTRRYPDRIVPAKKFKIQFARMGDPAFNGAVIDVLEEFHLRYDAPGCIPSISTIAPRGRDSFFERLLDVKQRRYSDARFQMQFSLHTTDESLRDVLMPVQKLSFAEIASLGEKFHSRGDRKVTLNFVAMERYPIDPAILARFFSPDIFIIKLTPLNPTTNASRHHLASRLDPHDAHSIDDLLARFHSHGYETIVSIGELEENTIGSNCGQYVTALHSELAAIAD